MPLETVVGCFMPSIPGQATQAPKTPRFQMDVSCPPYSVAVAPRFRDSTEPRVAPGLSGRAAA